MLVLRCIGKKSVGNVLPLTCLLSRGQKRREKVSFGFGWFWRGALNRTNARLLGSVINEPYRLDMLGVRSLFLEKRGDLRYSGHTCRRKPLNPQLLFECNVSRLFLLLLLLNTLF